MIDVEITHRKNNNIHERIGGLKGMFKVTKDWKENTGQGISSPLSIWTELAKRCPYYDQLLPIMGDRASSHG